VKVVENVVDVFVGVNAMRALEPRESSIWDMKYVNVQNLIWLHAYGLMRRIGTEAQEITCFVSVCLLFVLTEVKPQTFGKTE
jgi:hypothetical protein